MAEVETKNPWLAKWKNSHRRQQLTTTSSDETVNIPFSEDVDNCPTTPWTRLKARSFFCCKDVFLRTSQWKSLYSGGNITFLGEA